MTPAIAEIPVRSPAELTRRWADLLLNPPTFGLRSLYLGWFGRDGRQCPLVMPIDGIPLRPDDQLFPGLLGVHEAVVEMHDDEAAHLAMVLARPGVCRVDADDRSWAEALHELLDDRPGLTWSLHLAATGRVEQLVAPPADAFAGR